MLARNWEQLKYPSTGKWINIVLFPMDYYSEKKLTADTQWISKTLRLTQKNSHEKHMLFEFIYLIF